MIGAEQCVFSTPNEVNYILLLSDESRLDMKRREYIYFAYRDTRFSLVIFLTDILHSCQIFFRILSAAFNPSPVIRTRLETVRYIINSSGLTTEKLNIDAIP